MKRLMLSLALLGTAMLSAASVSADGEIVVVTGSRGVGTKITRLPYTITQPGFYYLDHDLTSSNGNGISVNQGMIDPSTNSHITIDLMGFCLFDTSGSGTAINGGSAPIEVRNGALKGWNVGVSGGLNSRTLNLCIEGCKFRGVELQMNSLVKGCVVFSGHGAIEAIRCESGVVSGNTVLGMQEPGSTGIYSSGATISNNYVKGFNEGIICAGPGNIIGNTITSINTRGIGIYNNITCLVSQNSVTAPTPCYSDPGAAVVKVNNAGF